MKHLAWKSIVEIQLDYVIKNAFGGRNKVLRKNEKKKIPFKISNWMKKKTGNEEKK